MRLKKVAHFLVWETEGWGWDIASLRRASTSNHHPVVPATEAEVSSVWPERVGAGRLSLPWAQLSDSFWDPKISNPSGSGTSWERKGGAGRAAFPLAIHLHQGGTKCCKHPSHDSCPSPAHPRDCHWEMGTGGQQRPWVTPSAAKGRWYLGQSMFFWSSPPRGCACHRYVGPMFKCLQKVKL